jgi:hypothetical protein
MNRGFVISAQNTSEVNYVKCADVLAASIKKLMPNEKVVLITNDKVKTKFFDDIVPLPHGDLDPTGKWKLVNDWQVYDASPFEYTIKLEADMYIPANIDYYWDVLKQRDVVISTNIRNYKQELSDVRFYRKFIDDNRLPDCYNALTYFKKSDLAKEFFAIVRDVFTNWKQYKEILKCKSDEEVSTDWAYSIACHILGTENTTMPEFKAFSMIHMKQWINGMPTENWTDTLIYEILPHTLRLNTIPQLYPFHYHIKNFSDKLEKLHV